LDGQKKIFGMHIFYGLKALATGGTGIFLDFGRSLLVTEV